MWAGCLKLWVESMEGMGTLSGGCARLSDGVAS